MSIIEYYNFQALKRSKYFLRLLLKHSALQLVWYLLSSFVETFPENSGIRGKKKYFTGHQTTDTNQLLLAIKGNFSGLFFFFEKAPQRLVDKCSHLFISIPLKQALSSGKKPV